MAKIIKPPYFDTVVNAGEKRLLDFLEANLPDSFYLIPNVEIASTNPRNNRTQYWEYDLLVVSPHAIYNLENKDWKGRIEGDDNYWYVNDLQRQNPLKTGRQKTAVLASKLKEQEVAWARAWVQNIVTLSYPNIYPPTLWQESASLTFQLDERLLNFLKDPGRVGKSKDNIADIYKEIVKYLDGSQSKKAINEKREVAGYEIIEILQQEANFTEYLVKPKGVTSSIRKRVKEYSLQVTGLSGPELMKREEAIKNQYKALNKIKAKPFILNVEFKIDEENHLFYEISDFLDENSLRAEARSKTFTFQEKISILRNIMAALKEAHKENVFHRDINPDNIYMSSGYAYLGNFGKSYFSDHNQQGYTVMATINEANATPYHPLELTVGDATRASDVYSFGILAYWLFTGEEPFKTPYDLDKMGGKLPENKLPTSLNKVLPKWLDELCNKTILTDDLKRIENFELVEKLIEDSLKEKDTVTSTNKTSQKAQNPPLNGYDLKVGDKVGDYVIHQILGKGGYSRVFKVKHQLQGKYYALKLFHESVNARSVIDEYNALVGLNHYNIVKFVWNGETPNGQFYTLMEFLEGENLSTYTRTDAKLPLYKVFRLAKEMLNALVFMQGLDNPILHRDIKPENVILDNEGRFVLIDFNVASFVDGNKDFVGTNPYLAPDLIAEGYRVNWDTSADTFALGITLYELVCKQYPWRPGKMPLLSKSPISSKEAEPRISDVFAEFLDKAINPRSTERFSDAREMLEALLKIGEDSILQESNVGTPLPNTLDEDLEIVRYINSLYSQSRAGNFGTRASANISKFDQLTYTLSKLDKKLLPDVLDGKYKLLIITGNAGDGKTAFIKRIEHDDSIEELIPHLHKNGARFKIDGVQFESNYDGSQDEDQRANSQVLEDFFKPFEGISNYSLSSEGRIIAINEGRLVEFLKTTTKHKLLHDTIENYFYNEGHHELPSGLMIINLNLRSVTAQENNEPSLFRSQVRALTNKELWNKCESCSLAEKCFIKYNVDSFNDSSSGEEVITRMEWLLKTASLKRELHITMRDLRSFIAYTITRDRDCTEIRSLLSSTQMTPEDYWQNYYFNITNPAIEDSGNQDRLIKLLRDTDIGEVAIPDRDRDLFFSNHQLKDYLEFSERKLNLHDFFDKNKIWLPAHEQDSSLIRRICNIQKIFIRHQYFEGKSELLEFENPYSVSTINPAELKFPSYLQRLPYQSVSKFVRVLAQADESVKIKSTISRAISLNEGCDNPEIDKDYLVLASTDTKDPYSKSFRLFALDTFELFVNKTDHLVKYLEYEADSLTFRHRHQKHIKLTISLDLFEMLHFIQQGFSPSLNDLRGKFIELIIFKNLLENLSYNEVVVTNDKMDFFKISKDEQSRLYIEPMEVKQWP